jgi:cyclopropane-fatty-acyl-phospholipid synthase
MNTTTVPTFAQRSTLPASAPAAARSVFRLLAGLAHGELDLQLPDGSTARFPVARPQRTATRRVDATLEQRAAIRLHNWNVFSRALKSGDIGFAESYLDGDWSSPDLAALLALFIANREHVEAVFYGTWWGRLAHRIKHLLNRNSRSGSAKNIQAHYDLGNDFYRQWLDPSMTYSAAWFEGRDPAGVELRDAQHAKLRRTLHEVGARPGSRVLEIGCGWGGLAEIAARETGAQVKGVTLSHEQLAWARERMQHSGLADRVELRLQDYRDLPQEHAAEPFDAIVSIEMFEAVGREYWSGYFDTLRRCLKPGGRACIQSITIRDDLFERYVKSTDFIQQYIFPGGLLPSPTAFEAEARRAGFTIENRLAFGRDYAETLRRWRANFLRHEQTMIEQGFDTRFMRIWEFYLAYCEAAFDTGNTDVMQFTLRRAA